MELTNGWTQRAACRSHAPVVFFPNAKSGPEKLRAEREALAVCRPCPVKRECLRFALDNGEEAGVWGGMTEDQRRALVRDKRRTRSA